MTTHRVALILLLSGSLWARLAGWPNPLDGADPPSGQIHRFHPDEQTVVDRALALENPLAPRLTAYGLLPLYLARVTASLTASLTQPSDEVTAERDLYASLRMLAAFISWAGVWLTWYFGRRFWGDTVGLLSAIWVGLSPLAIQHGHFYTVDGLFTVLATAALGCIGAALTTGRMAWFVAAGALTGLLAAVRLSGASMAAVIVIGTCAAQPTVRQSLQALRAPQLWVYTAVAVAVLAVIQPYLIWAPELLLRSASPDDLAFSLAIARGDLLRPWTLIDLETVPYLHHWLSLWPQSVGWPMTLLLAAGLVGVAWTRERVSWLVALWSVLYFLPVGALHTKHVRYLLPMLPVLAWLAALLSVRLARWRGSVAVLATGACTLHLLWYGAAFTRVYRVTDARVQAAQWMAEEIPPGSSIAVERGGFSLRKLIDHDRYEIVGLDALSFFDLQGYLTCGAVIDRLRPRLLRSDYIAIIDVNRLRQFGAVPDRYPGAAGFYRRLISGRLGFVEVQRFKTYPRFLGVEFLDDDAEPSFLGYDHPAVLVFAGRGQAAVADALRSWEEDLAADRHCADALMVPLVDGVTGGDGTQVLQQVTDLQERFPRLRILDLIAASLHQRLGAHEAARLATAAYRSGYYRGRTFLGIPAAAALSLTRLGLYQEAMLALSDGLQLRDAQRDSYDPANARYAALTYVDVGDALVKAAQPDLAFRAFAMGLEISEEPKALHRLAELSAAGRQWDAARRFWERSLTLDPEQPAVRGRLRELEDLRRR